METIQQHEIATPCIVFEDISVTEYNSAALNGEAIKSNFIPFLKGMRVLEQFFPDQTPRFQEELDDACIGSLLEITNHSVDADCSKGTVTAYRKVGNETWAKD